MQSAIDVVFDPQQMGLESNCEKSGRFTATNIAQFRYLVCMSVAVAAAGKLSNDNAVSTVLRCQEGIPCPSHGCQRGLMREKAHCTISLNLCPYLNKALLERNSHLRILELGCWERVYSELEIKRLRLTAETQTQRLDSHHP